MTTLDSKKERLEAPENVEQVSCVSVQRCKRNTQVLVRMYETDDHIIRLMLEPIEDDVDLTDGSRPARNKPPVKSQGSLSGAWNLFLARSERYLPWVLVFLEVVP